MMELHWMVWSIALGRGAMVGGVAQIANRVAFCMGLLCDLYTTIVHTISIILHHPTIRLNGLIALLNSLSLTPMPIKTQFLDIAIIIYSTSQPHPVPVRIGSLPSVVK